MRRRALLAGLGAAALCRPADATTHRRMVPAWAPHRGCVMAFGRDVPPEVRQDQRRLAEAVAAFEPVLLLFTPPGGTALEAMGTQPVFTPLHHDTIWTGETLPTFSRDEDGLIATGWNVSATAERFAHGAVHFHPPLSLRYEQAQIAAGAHMIDTDGAGTVLVSETSLMARNPGHSRAAIETALRQQTGAGRVLWLWGSESDFITHGAVHRLARFTAPGVVVVDVSDDKEDPEYADLQENAVRLEAEPGLEVRRLFRPRWEAMPARGPDFAAAYVDSYMANGGLILPRFGDQRRDDAARALFTSLLPDRKIIQISVDALAETGGGIARATMALPA